LRVVRCLFFNPKPATGNPQPKTEDMLLLSTQNQCLFLQPKTGNQKQKTEACFFYQPKIGVCFFNPKPATQNRKLKQCFFYQPKIGACFFNPKPAIHNQKQKTEAMLLLSTQNQCLFLQPTTDNRQPTTEQQTL